MPLFRQQRIPRVLGLVMMGLISNLKEAEEEEEAVSIGVVQ